MGLLTARTCCFCLDLRAGGLALGYLFLLSACYGIVQPIFQTQHSSHHEYRNSPIFAAKIGIQMIIFPFQIRFNGKHAFQIGCSWLSNPFVCVDCMADRNL